MSEHQWCKKQGKGHSLVTQRRRLRLLQPGAFKCYLHHRRKFGDNGMYGLDYATVISRLPLPGEGKIVTSARQPASVLFDDGTFDPEWVNLITADCVPEMRKMPPKWYHVIVTSFPLSAGAAVLRSGRQADRVRFRADVGRMAAQSSSGCWP